MKKFDMKKFIIKTVTIILIIFFVKAYALADIYQEKFQKMNHLDYNVTLNDDGSMKVVETWDIYIGNTNTIFKNFNKTTRFGEIINVSVKDLDTNRELTQIYTEMYHVTTDCFYALDIKGSQFEIAWGTGMENSHGNRKYQITYTVTDAATQYNDCQELYWMFLSPTNAIPVKKVTGTITLPSRVSNIENLKVWGHGPLNGKIERTATNKVTFKIEDLSSNSMLETRVVTTDRIMESISPTKINNYNYLPSIISEETGWADESNQLSDIWKIAATIAIVLYVLILILRIINITKYYKIYKKKNDGIQKIDLKYYRDIPRENTSTPMEASYMYNFTKSLNKKGNYQSDVVAANILNLALKRYVGIRFDGKKAYIKILRDNDGLKDDENAIYTLLKKAGKKEEEFEIEKLNTYAKAHYYEYSDLINKMVNNARENLYKEQLVDKGEKQMYEKSKNAHTALSFVLTCIEIVIFWMAISSIPFFSVFNILPVKTVATISLIALPFIITSVIKNIILSKTQNKIAVLTQKGYEEEQQWKALANFLKDYSKLEEATVPSLAIWEKYLVFATTFGIADEVIKEMKAKYPQVFVEEYWQGEKTEQYPILNFTIYSGMHSELVDVSPIQSISSGASRAYHTSAREIASHTSSSGSGGGGGFSGGGGGRRRRWPEWEEDSFSKGDRSFSIGDTSLTKKNRPPTKKNRPPTKKNRPQLKKEEDHGREKENFNRR